MSEEDHAEAVLGKHAHVVSDTIEVDFSRSQKKCSRLLQKKKSNTDPPKRGPRSDEQRKGRRTVETRTQHASRGGTNESC